MRDGKFQLLPVHTRSLATALTPQLSAADLQKLDELCNECESAWMAGLAPRTEEYLTPTNEPFRTVLLAELLRLELHYRSDWTLEELKGRFPNVAHELLATTAQEAQAAGPAVGKLPTIPGYQVYRVLGRGGMGIVYEAHDPQLDRHVAIKMLHAAQHSPGGRARFASEARAVAQLHHPNLVQIFDVGEVNGQPYLVFELMEGGTLSSLCGNGPIEIKKAVEILESLSLAIQFAHERKIIHRDLKPSNILLTAGGRIAKVGDFGLAKRVGDDSTKTISGMLMGTPAYMPPEHATETRVEVSPAVDIYSLGAILYEMLTGHPPFKAASTLETLDLLKNHDPVRPSFLNPLVPRDLETICLKCLQKDPQLRYSSAQLLADELGRFQRNESIMARPVGLIEQGRRFFRRHPAVTGLTAALALVIAIGFIAIGYFWRDAVKQQNLAERSAALMVQQRDEALKAKDEAQRLERQARELRFTAESHQKQAEINATKAKQQAELAEKNAESLKQEKERAELNLKAAESRFDKAQSAVGELFSLGNRLMKVPNMQEYGRSAIEKGTAFKEALLAEKNDDPRVQHGTAKSVINLAWIQMGLGLNKEAEQSFRSAIERLKKVQALTGNTDELLRDLRRAHCFCGVTISRLDRIPEAEVEVRESVRLARMIHERHPSYIEDQMSLGNCLMNLVPLQRTLGRNADALATCSEAVRIQRQVSLAMPNYVLAQTELALALAENSILLLNNNDRDEGKQVAIESRQLHRRVLDQSSKSPEDVVYYARSCLNLSWILRIERNFDEAERVLLEALDETTAATNRFPSVKGSRLIHLSVLQTLAATYVQMKAAEKRSKVISKLESEIREMAQAFPNDSEVRLRYVSLLGLVSEDQSQRGDFESAWATANDGFNMALSLVQSGDESATARESLLSAARIVSNCPPRFEREAEKIEATRVCADLFPEDSRALNSYSWHLIVTRDRSLRNPQLAVDLARRGVEANPTWAYVHNTLGVAYYRCDRLVEALQEFEQSITLSRPGTPSDWYFMAMIHHRQGHREESLKWLAMAYEWAIARPNSDEELPGFEAEALETMGILISDIESWIAKDRPAIPDLPSEG